MPDEDVKFLFFSTLMIVYFTGDSTSILLILCINVGNINYGPCGSYVLKWGSDADNEANVTTFA